MPRLDMFKVRLQTGEKGPGGAPKYNINGFPLNFDEHAGGTGPGETLEAVGYPASFPHSLTLTGPSEGEWDIDGAEITYECSGMETYKIRLGHVTLDDESDLNLWHEPPPKVFDV